MSLLDDFLAARLIRKSGLFDPTWYLACNADLLGGTCDPIRHYVRYGAAEGRNPSPLFDTIFYLTQYPDLDTSAINPLCHYILLGEQEGAWPNQFFDPIAVANTFDSQHYKKHGVLASYIEDNSLHLLTNDRLNAAISSDEKRMTKSVGICPISFAISKNYELNLNALMSKRQSIFKIEAINGLTPLAFDKGHMFFLVKDNDPYIVFSPIGSEIIAAGYYRLQLSLSKPETSLYRAKLYLNSHNGFNEAETINPRFHLDENGVATSLIAIDHPFRQIRLDPVDSRLDGNLVYGVGEISLEKITDQTFYRSLINQMATSQVHKAKLLGRTVLDVVSSGPANALSKLHMEYEERTRFIFETVGKSVVYRSWISEFDTLTDADKEAIKRSIEDMPVKPKISILMPVYNTPETLLINCIESVITQIYPNWELCIAEDLSPEPHVRDILERYSAADDRIKVTFRSENGHICKATNSAISLASGDWMALLDHDDLLAPHALFCIADAINRNPQAKMFYSDEDKIGLDGMRSDPYFKSDWNERLFFEQNMVSHLGVYDAALVREIGGFRVGFEGAQDHDLVLRLVEYLSTDQIIHIPHILYHWRIMPGSTALGATEKSYALDAGIKALKDAMERRGINATIAASSDLTYYRVKLAPPQPEPLVSIIIPTRDGLDVLEPCISSVLEKTTYKNYEILIVDNQSTKPETIVYLEKIAEHPQVILLSYNEVFNYSAINNFAVEHSNGSLICLLNNDTEVIAHDWLTEMVAELSLPNIGAVGAKLLYTDGTVQHAGVVLGVGGDMGVAGHGLLGLGQDEAGYFSYARLAREVSAVTAACLLTTRQIFKDVEGLNTTQLSVAFNDIDFCLKVREAGHKIIWTPNALLYHHESKTRGLEDTPEKQRRFSGEVLYMLDRWGDLLHRDPYYNPNLNLSGETYLLSSTPRVKYPWKDPMSGKAK